jgi:hypothetical protein
MLATMTNFDELEYDARKYSESKQHKELEYESKKIAIRLIDSISSVDFVFPLQKQGVVSNGTTSYVYMNNLTYPNLFEFIAEILHVEIPITINNARFGPGEIVVYRENEEEAKQDLSLCVKELQKLIHARKAKILTK